MYIRTAYAGKFDYGSGIQSGIDAAKANDADIAFSGYDRVDLDTGKTVSTEMTQHGTMNKDVDWNDDFIVYANPSLWNKLYRREIVKDLEFLPFSSEKKIYTEKTWEYIERFI